MCVCDPFPSCRENRAFQVQGVSQEKQGTLEQMWVAFHTQTIPGEKLVKAYFQSEGRAFKVTRAVAGHRGKPWRSWIKGRPRTSWTKGSVLYLRRLRQCERLLTVYFYFLRETRGDLDLTILDPEEKPYDFTVELQRVCTGVPEAAVVSAGGQRRSR